MTRKALVVGVVSLLALAVLASPGMCQGGPPAGDGQGGFGGPRGALMMQPSAPTPVMLVVDGVLYIACDGKVFAFEAKTLKKLAEATYLEPRQRGQGPRGGRQGQGGGNDNQAGPPPPPPAN